MSGLGLLWLHLVNHRRGIEGVLMKKFDCPEKKAFDSSTRLSLMKSVKIMSLDALMVAISAFFDTTAHGNRLCRN